MDSILHIFSFLPSRNLLLTTLVSQKLIECSGTCSSFAWGCPHSLQHQQLFHDGVQTKDSTILGIKMHLNDFL